MIEKKLCVTCGKDYCICFLPPTIPICTTCTNFRAALDWAKSSSGQRVMTIGGYSIFIDTLFRIAKM